VCRDVCESCRYEAAASFSWDKLSVHWPGVSVSLSCGGIKWAKCRTLQSDELGNKR
jgi:hypothetical protein